MKPLRVLLLAVMLAPWAPTANAESYSNLDFNPKVFIEKSSWIQGNYNQYGKLIGGEH